MSKENLPIPNGFSTVFNIIDTSAFSIINNSVKFNNSIVYKFERISTGENPFKLDDTHYFIEIDNPDTKTILLPKIKLLPAIQYIIRKKFDGELIILPSYEETIENRASITLRSRDQIIKLINDTLNTWIIL
jgi:hypothetical protein